MFYDMLYVLKFYVRHPVKGVGMENAERIKLESSLKKTALMTSRVTPVELRALRAYAQFRHQSISAVLVAPAIERLKLDPTFVEIYDYELIKERLNDTNAVHG